jgi:hypothetical protein
MTLTTKEFNDYLKTHLGLLYFMGQQANIISTKTKFNEFRNLDLQVKFKCREFFFDNEDLLDEYIASNFDHLTNDEITILNGFKRKISSNFVILKCLKKNAIFIDTKDNKFYAVKALSDPFDDFFDKFPVNMTTTLIPFFDKIIYDGFIQSSGIYYGPGITKTLNEEYKIAKLNKNIVTTIDA